MGQSRFSPFSPVFNFGKAREPEAPHCLDLRPALGLHR
jgi:hypothetical protein